MKKIISKVGLRFDRSFSKGMLKQLTWLFVIMVIMYVLLVALSYIHALYTPGEKGNLGRWFDVLFVLIDPGSSSEAMSSPFIVLCAILGLVVFSGMLISVLSNILKNRVNNYLKGETNYHFSDHVVILGFNKGLPSLINKLHNEYPTSYIITMCNRDIEEVRDFLYANLEDSIENSIIFMNGIRNAKDDLRRLRLNNRVKAIYILGEENEPAHDAINMECLEKISDLMKCKEKVNCYVQFYSQTMLSALQKVDFKEPIKNHLELQPFILEEIWAQKALATIANNGYKSLDGDGITVNSDKHVHLIIVGTSSLGWSLAVNAAHILHFPNFVPGKLDTYSKITFIDTDASGFGKRFRMRYHNLFDMARWREVNAQQSLDTDSYWVDPLADKESTSPYKHLGPVNFMDIQWEFIEGEIFDPFAMRYLEAVVAESRSITTIALCMDDSGLNSATCLSFSEKIRMGASEILVRQCESGKTIDMLRRAVGFENIRAFGMMNECYAENLNTDKFGKLINACYCGCSLDGSEEDNNKCDENWMSASPLDRNSSNYCANMLFYKFRSLGLDTSKPLTQTEVEEATSEKNHDVIQTTEHNRWITERLLLGLRPLYKDELETWEADLKVKNKEEIRKAKKQQKLAMRHVDICSNAQLVKYDPAAISFDTILNEKLWRLYEIASKK